VPGHFPNLTLHQESIGAIFVLLGFNLSNIETDTLESTSILIYFQTHMGLYTQEGG